MKKIGVFLLFVVCTFTGKVWAAPLLSVNPNMIEAQVGETKIIDIVSSLDGIITEGTMTIVTTSKYISLVSVTTENSLTAKNTGSTTSFSSKKGIRNGEKIGTITIRVIPGTPLGTTGTISISAIKLQNDVGKEIKGDNLISTITVVEDKKSTDDTLESLLSSIAKIPFQKDNYSYSVEVDNTVKKMDLEAVASDDKASVKISDQTLKVGKNEIVITVLSESGSKKEYKVEVLRKEGKEETALPKNANGKYIVVLIGSAIVIILDVLYMYKRKK